MTQSRTIELLRASLDEKDLELTQSKQIAQQKEAEAIEATEKLTR